MVFPVPGYTRPGVSHPSNTAVALDKNLQRPMALIKKHKKSSQKMFIKTGTPGDPKPFGKLKDIHFMTYQESKFFNN